MKKIVYFMMAAAIALVSCKKTEDKINDVQVSLTKGGEAFAVENVEVSLRSSANATVYTALTDANGVAVFQMKAGAYEASATLYQNSDIYNGTNSAVIVTDGAENAFKLDMVASKTSQVIIKELYFGGCVDDAGKFFQNDKYVILYNNSPVEADASKYAFGMLCPTNSNMTSKWMKDGKLSYTDYMPMWAACWWFQGSVKIPAYSQIVVAMNGAVNHSATVSNSVDLSHADYAMYDPEVFSNAKVYPAPDASIPTDHYLKTYLYGLGNAWGISTISPGFVVFAPEGTTTEAFVKNPDNIEMPANAMQSAKVPLDWVKDAVEVFDNSKMELNKKRILASADAGYVKFVNKLGYTVYRNVDKAATEALPENEGKLVYNYAGGTEAEEGGSTDPSGIDAEASIANGAHIIYKDTNNSTNDFHQRKVASLKK